MLSQHNSIGQSQNESMPLRRRENDSFATSNSGDQYYYTQAQQSQQHGGSSGSGGGSWDNAHSQHVLFSTTPSKSRRIKSRSHRNNQNHWSQQFNSDPWLVQTAMKAVLLSPIVVLVVWGTIVGLTWSSSSKSHNLLESSMQIQPQQQLYRHPQRRQQQERNMGRAQRSLFRWGNARRNRRNDAATVEQEQQPYYLESQQAPLLAAANLIAQPPQFGAAADAASASGNVVWEQQQQQHQGPLTDTQRYYTFPPQQRQYENKQQQVPLTDTQHYYTFAPQQQQQMQYQQQQRQQQRPLYQDEQLQPIQQQLQLAPPLGLAQQQEQQQPAVSSAEAQTYDDDAFLEQSSNNRQQQQQQQAMQGGQWARSRPRRSSAVATSQLVQPLQPLESTAALTVPALTRSLPFASQQQQQQNALPHWHNLRGNSGNSQPQQSKEHVRYFYYDPKEMTAARHTGKSNHGGSIAVAWHLPHVVVDALSGRRVSLAALSAVAPIVVQEPKAPSLHHFNATMMNSTTAYASNVTYGNYSHDHPSVVNTRQKRTMAWWPPQHLTNSLFGSDSSKKASSSRPRLFNTSTSTNTATAADKSLLVCTVGVMALLVGALSARRLRHRSILLSLCVDGAAAYDDDGTTDGPMDQGHPMARGSGTNANVASHSYHTFGAASGGWKGDLEKFDV